jgi:hypothetical protein
MSDRPSQRDFHFSHFWDGAHLSGLAYVAVYVSGFDGEDAGVIELGMVAEIYILFQQG